MSTDIEQARKAIETARQHRVTDPHLSSFVLRDLEVTTDAGLDDLAWAFHKGAPTTKDVDGLIEGIERYIAKAEAENVAEAADPLCDECGKFPKDEPSRLCAGCDAYREHTAI